jgi:hypothetical protein
MEEYTEKTGHFMLIYDKVSEGKGHTRRKIKKEGRREERRQQGERDTIIICTIAL